MKFLRFFILMACLLPAAPALAHRVHLFAAVRGGEIVADCRFSKHNPARHAQIEVFDAATGRPLLRGQSDAQGAARLPLPSELAAHPVDLRVVLEAGEGHRAEWRIGADELRSAAAPSVPAADHPGCISPEDLAARLRDQEARLRAEMAAEQNARGPGLTEIIGGLGWIAGIFSLIAALKRRARRQTS